MADVAVASIPAAPVATEGASGNHDNNPQPPPASEAAPNEAAPSPPKRPRTEEPGEDDGDHKRLKSNEEIVPMNLDLGAMLENALLSFEEPPPAKEPSPPVEPILKQETFEPPPAPPPRRRPPKPPPKKMIFIENPVYFVRAMNLQLLGNLAVQILLALFQQPREDSDRVLRVEQSEAGKVFKALKETFYQHLRLFSDSTKLIRADDLDISEPGDRETIEMVNLANFCVSCSFGPGGPTMAEMHEQFLKTFIPEGGAITEELARVYLSQKTQSYLAYAKVIDDTNEARAHLLNRFFPASLEGTLKHLHSEAQLRIPEADFVAPFKAMRTLLQTDGNVSEKRKALEEKYPFAGFLDELSSYMRANMTGTLEYADSHGINVPVIEEPDLGDDGEDRFDETEADSLAAALQAASNVFADANHKAQGVETNGTDHSALSDSLGLGKLLQESLQGQLAAQGEQGSVANGDNVFESKGLASLLFEKLGGGYEGDFSGNQAQASMAQAANAQMYNSPYGTQFNPQQQYYAYQQPMQQQQGSGQETADGLPPTQSLPTSVLYERARQAAVAKSSAHARREGLHSTRRPWTPEEEKALMAGLDMVKGPHWSQILQLFGQNGTLSDILKDRTQVQLKDKARNLKLFFLKTNSEMPYYLQCVTGELKTRAPSQAARKEAEERARLNSEEEQARIAGIMTLAGGLQNNSPTTNGKSAPYSNGLANGGSVRSNPPVAGVPVANAGTAPPIQSMAPIQPAPSVPPVVKAEPPDTSILQPPPQHQSQPQPETQLQPQAQPQSQTQAHNEPPQPIQEVHQAESIGGPDTAMDANSTSTSMDLDLMQQLTAALSSTS